MIALQRGVDGGALHPAVEPLGDRFPQRLQGRHAGAGRRGRTQHRCQLRVFRQLYGQIKPTALVRHRAQLFELASAHQLGSRDIAIRIPLAHAHQDLSVVKHLESPLAHRVLREKARSVRDGVGVRDLVRTSQWRLYADPQLAPLRRSWNGSITPITQWLHYADHVLAPLGDPGLAP